jgi:hypothetical protein
MAKKRGGLAGLYDRNKGIFRTAAILGGTALGGPAGGALAGAAMRGLDREGKRGIGFDPFAALPGAVEGYAMGKTAQAVGGGLKNLFAAKSAPALPGLDVQQMIGMTPGTTNVASALIPTGAAAPSLASAAAPAARAAAAATSSAPKSRLQQLLTGSKENWDVLSGLGRGIAGTMDLQQQAAIERLKAEQDAARLRLEEQRFQLGKQETEADRENRRRLTQLLMPMLQAQMSNVLPSPQPMNR